MKGGNIPMVELAFLAELSAVEDASGVAGVSGDDSSSVVRCASSLAGTLSLVSSDEGAGAGAGASGMNKFDKQEHDEVDGITSTHDDNNNNNINNKNNKTQTQSKQTLRGAIERIATNETVLPVTTKGGSSRTSQTRIVALHTYLVRFETAAGARAAVREKQSAEVRGGTVLLSRYSRQIVSDDVVV
mmetsp:Transcript_16276/g.19282  ORF Transcript_16276/g.19282 Transcript_16276/m.19282 type:complete len:187 (+) Transcript_16276:2341-2901(+)